jgi:hypothetical protein
LSQIGCKAGGFQIAWEAYQTLPVNLTWSFFQALSFDLANPDDTSSQKVSDVDKNFFFITEAASWTLKHGMFLTTCGWAVLGQVPPLPLDTNEPEKLARNKPSLFFLSVSMTLEKSLYL